VGCVLALLALTAAGCGGTTGGTKASGNPLTIYSSLPLQGASREQSQAVVNGANLALKEQNGRAGSFQIRYTSLDDATAQAGKWDPNQVSANARKVAQDQSAIGYLGEFNSGASAVSIPILNQVPMPMISPANTAVGLTSGEAGAKPGEPNKYYPSGKRNFVRVVPKDTIQGAAVATYMKNKGCTKISILNDKEVYGAGLASNVEAAAHKVGLQVLGNQGIDPKAPNYRSLASDIASHGADCVMFSGITENNAVQLFKDLAAGLPNAKLFGPDGVAEASFSNPAKGGIPPDVAARTFVTVATLAPSEYPPEGQKFFADYKATYGDANPDPYAIYGYEAMKLMLDAINRAGANGNDRQAVINQLFGTKDRPSVLGSYSIDKNGDTSITDYGGQKIVDGKIVFEQRIKPQGL
jgi:branched-chain amino acid transport system substrate-binding protein